MRVSQLSLTFCMTWLAACEGCAGETCAPATQTAVDDGEPRESGLDVCGGSWFRATRASCAGGSECTDDGDCGPAGACVCASISPDEEEVLTERALCVVAECAVDGDCGEHRCGVERSCTGAAVALRCQTPRDECETSAQCPERHICNFDVGRGHWTCQESPSCFE